MDTFFEGLAPGPRNLLTDVAGLAVGNAGDPVALSGVTVVLADPAAIAAVDIRGGAPGTRETDALDPLGLVGQANAVVLAGGSVYGLEAASALTPWLAQRGRGYRLRAGTLPVPIVPSAILFDLANGGDKDWGAQPPYGGLAIQAAEAAAADFALGNEGAGLGAIAGTYKGGLGSASIASAAGLVVAGLVAVNAVGSPVMPGTGTFWAAPFELDREFGGRPPAWTGTVSALPPFDATKLAGRGGRAPANTTIAVVATNADLTPVEAKRMAIMAADGLARALRPAHTPFDGDTVFALATGRLALPEPRPLALAGIGALAADTLARAIARGVCEAASVGDILAWRDRHPADPAR